MSASRSSPPRRAILAVETSTRVCSVALWDGVRLLERTRVGAGVHSAGLPSMTGELLGEAGLAVGELAAVLLTGGPGSYTGLRIGVSFVKGLLMPAPHVRFHVAGSLPMIAIGAWRQCDPSLAGDSVRVHAFIDARREHLYSWCGEFRGKTGEFTEILPPSVRPLAELEGFVRPGDVISGTGWQRLSMAQANARAATGEEAIGAGTLIHAFSEPVWHKVFRRWDPSDFTPDYLGGYSSAPGG